MQIKIINDLTQINAQQWNALNIDANPFLQHEFLSALEKHNCVGAQFGWLPYHLVAYQNHKIVAAMPLYLKDNSYGEFVFDHTWADAYHRHGINYYPKLVAALPYTPVTSKRILFNSNQVAIDYSLASTALFERAIQLSNELNVSSLHFQFPLESELDALESPETFRRIGVQFHWQNHQYNTFEDFLSSLNSSKRKKLKRDRRFVQDANITIKITDGENANIEQITQAAHFYQTTFAEKYGLATLNLNFFKEICNTMGKQIIYFFAYEGTEIIACAICFKNNETLYGRHWGCTKKINGLHFELCYHQGIEYCIDNKLNFFEPGAQGEHKISRGFLPTLTYSSHWIAHPQFRDALREHSKTETEATIDYHKQLMQRSPYQKNK